jgi:hypothetical protein
VHFVAANSERCECLQKAPPEFIRRDISRTVSLREIARSKMQRKLYKFDMRLKLINLFAAPS